MTEKDLLMVSQLKEIHKKQRTFYMKCDGNTPSNKSEIMLSHEAADSYLT